MVKVKGTHGIVDIQVLGITAVMDRIRRAGLEIERGADAGVVKAGTYVSEEVQESIMGNRAEPMSVDTGRFGNSIEFNKTGTAEGVVKPRKENYPEGGNTEDVAMLMEYSPNVKGGPRRHFRNTEARTKGKVNDMIEDQIKKVKL